MGLLCVQENPEDRPFMQLCSIWRMDAQHYQRQITLHILHKEIVIWSK
jgi:hypothetical protein